MLSVRPQLLRVLVHKDKSLQIRQMDDLTARFRDPGPGSDLMRDKGRPDGFASEFAVEHRGLEADGAGVALAVEDEGVVEAVVGDSALEEYVFVGEAVVRDGVTGVAVVGAEGEEGAEEEDEALVAGEAEAGPEVGVLVAELVEFDGGGHALDFERGEVDGRVFAGAGGAERAAEDSGAFVVGALVESDEEIAAVEGPGGRGKGECQEVRTRR